jgi:hypothetical protein
MALKSPSCSDKAVRRRSVLHLLEGKLYGRVHTPLGGSRGLNWLFLPSEGLQTPIDVRLSADCAAVACNKGLT